MITLRQIVELAKNATEEQLDQPIEICVRTFTSAHGTYPEPFDVKLDFSKLRIAVSYPEGISVHERKQK
jgi:hypothetical protein